MEKGVQAGKSTSGPPVYTRASNLKYVSNDSNLLSTSWSAEEPVRSTTASTTVAAASTTALSYGRCGPFAILKPKNRKTEESLGPCEYKQVSW